MLCTEGSILYSGKSEAKENLSGCCFVNTNLLEERTQVLLSVKELSKLPDNSPNIIKKSNIDRYMERPSAPFCDENNSILNDFYYTEFLAYHTLVNKSSKTSKYQPDELDDNLIENNHKEFSYPPKINLMISGEIMHCQKVRRILRYHVPNKLLSPEKFTHHVILLPFPFRVKNNCYQVFHHCSKTKPQEKEVQHVVHKNKINFEPYGALVNQGFSLLVKIICKAISKTLFYHCKGIGKPRVLLIGLTGISVAFRSWN